MYTFFQFSTGLTLNKYTIQNIEVQPDYIIVYLPVGVTDSGILSNNKLMITDKKTYIRFMEWLIVNGLFKEVN